MDGILETNKRALSSSMVDRYNQAVVPDTSVR